MQIIDNLVIVMLIVLAFIAGMKVSDGYHNRATTDKKEALEKQYLRLRAKADADDPCRPYGTPQFVQPVKYNTGDFDGDPPQPISPQFMEQLKKTGQARTTFKKSDLTK